MKLAILGFGGVGKAFLHLLHEKKNHLKEIHLDLQVLYIFNSKGCLYMPEGIPIEDLSRHLRSGGTLENYPLNVFYEATYETMIENGDADMLIELTPTNIETGQPALGYIERALKRGMHVISGNKGPIVHNYHGLKNMAYENGVQLGIGCTVGGALPSMNAGLFDIAGSDIQTIEGVLNGTSNHILNMMEKHGVSYEEALAMAQKAGISEANPRLDVEGFDTASKLLILTNVLCKQKHSLDKIHIEGITGLTHEDIYVAKMENKKYKLIGRATRTLHDFIVKVSLEKIDASHPFYNVDGKNKAVRFTTDTMGELTLIGGASGTTPAAASILRDIINIHRGYKFIW